MLLGYAGIIAGFVLVALLLLSLNFYSRWPWLVKVSATVVVSAFYVVVYNSFPLLLGWPTSQDLPDRFNLIAVQVAEPDKLTGSDGSIYLWVTDMLAGSSDAEPRSYRLPYSVELHSQVQEAGNKLRKKLPQLGEIEMEEPGKNAKITEANRLGTASSTRIKFYDLPDPLFPEK